MDSALNELSWSSILAADIQVQEAFSLAKTADPTGKRTIGKSLLPYWLALSELIPKHGRRRHHQGRHVAG